MRITPSSYIQFKDRSDRFQPGRVVWCHETFVAAEVDRRHFPWSAEDELEIYYEIDNTFVEQTAIMQGALDRDAANPPTHVDRKRMNLDRDAALIVVVCELIEPPAGQVVVAENRSCPRVSTVAYGKMATFGEQSRCELRDISPAGFSIVTSQQYETDDIVAAALSDRGKDAAGRVRIRNCQKLSDGQYRYGVVCLERKIKEFCGDLSVRLRRQQAREPVGT